MTLRSIRNHYRGINAHAQSFFQNQSGWVDFHSDFMTDLARVIQPHLPKGYIVRKEQSLQIQDVPPNVTYERPRRTIPDATLYAQQPERAAPLGTVAATPILAQRLPDTVLSAEEVFYPAVIISRLNDASLFGTPVTRIELLSPSNKAATAREHYLRNRAEAIRSDVNLVEIDLMHQTATLVPNLPVYPDAPNAYPYTITISSPEPSLEEGYAHTYGFAVDEPLPPLPVPLSQGDKIRVDFGMVYTATYEALLAHSFGVDYEQPPLRFERYSAADQARIRRRMAAVQRAHAAGVDLDAHAPLSLDGGETST